ncbi:hypothetical protein C8R43DRAFT_637695 [Mycena crocata]|nr:hypothetical protein C8R43DRAFT_637695 [Mycena crocata]
MHIPTANFMLVWLDFGAFIRVCISHRSQRVESLTLRIFTGCALPRTSLSHFLFDLLFCGWVPPLHRASFAASIFSPPSLLRLPGSLGFSTLCALFPLLRSSTSLNLPIRIGIHSFGSDCLAPQVWCSLLCLFLRQFDLLVFPPYSTALGALQVPLPFPSESQPFFHVSIRILASLHKPHSPRIQIAILQVPCCSSKFALFPRVHLTWFQFASSPARLQFARGRFRS